MTVCKSAPATPRAFLHFVLKKRKEIGWVKLIFAKTWSWWKKRLFYVGLHHQLEVTDLSCALTECSQHLHLNISLQLHPSLWNKRHFMFSPHPLSQPNPAKSVCTAARIRRKAPVSWLQWALHSPSRCSSELPLDGAAQNGLGIESSQAVTHPTLCRAKPCLTSMITWQTGYSRWYVLSLFKSKHLVYQY